MAETVRTRHKISGAIDENTPRHIAEHSILGRHLEIVGPDAKPYLPEMHKPKTGTLHAGETVIPKDELPKVALPEITPEVIAKEHKEQANPKNSKD